MADNKELVVIHVECRKLGTYYRINAAGKASSAGLVSVKHTLKDTWFCGTCVVAFRALTPEGLPDHNNKGCEHTRCAMRYAESHPEPDDDALVAIVASETGAPPADELDVDEDYQ